MMEKLLAKYRSEPSVKNLEKLKSYYVKHPFAGCLLSIEDQSFVASLVKLPVIDKQGFVLIDKP